MCWLAHGYKLTPVELLCDIYLWNTSKCCNRLRLSASCCCYGKTCCDDHFSAVQWLHHPVLYLFGHWFQIWNKKFHIKKLDHTGHLKFLKVQLGTKKLKFCSFKEWSYRLWMTREFQIWLQCLNQRSCPHFWSKNDQKLDFASFCQIGQKGGQILFNLIFETRFEILSSFAAYKTP